MVFRFFFFREESGKGLSPRDDHFVADAGTEDVLRIVLWRHGDDGRGEVRCVVEMVFQHVKVDVTKVFVSDVLQ